MVGSISDFDAKSRELLGLSTGPPLLLFDTSRDPRRMDIFRILRTQQALNSQFCFAVTRWIFTNSRTSMNFVKFRLGHLNWLRHLGRIQSPLCWHIHCGAPQLALWIDQKWSILRRLDRFPAQEDPRIFHQGRIRTLLSLDIPPEHPCLFVHHVWLLELWEPVKRTQ